VMPCSSCVNCVSMQINIIIIITNDDQSCAHSSTLLSGARDRRVKLRELIVPGRGDRARPSCAPAFCTASACGSHHEPGAAAAGPLARRGPRATSVTSACAGASCLRERAARAAAACPGTTRSALGAFEAQAARRARPGRRGEGTPHRRRATTAEPLVAAGQIDAGDRSIDRLSVEPECSTRARSRSQLIETIEVAALTN
jgi:hypothetical protein